MLELVEVLDDPPCDDEPQPLDVEVEPPQLEEPPHDEEPPLEVAPLEVDVELLVEVLELDDVLELVEVLDDPPVEVEVEECLILILTEPPGFDV